MTAGVVTAIGKATGGASLTAPSGLGATPSVVVMAGTTLSPTRTMMTQ